MSDLSRREFLRVGGAGGVALVLGVSAERRVVPVSMGAARSDFAPSQWLRVDTTGVVTLYSARCEMGQGVRTALPMILAEELDIDWSHVVIEQVRPGPSYRGMRTSGSDSVSEGWRELRLPAAAAREMLVAAAAREWAVDSSACTTQGGHVLHAATGRRLGYGALVAAASRLPVPASPRLKPEGTFGLLGTRVARIDGPGLVDGSARFGLDARPAGVPVAVIARPPQHGATIRRWTEGRARRMPGVVAIARVPSGVAVVADGTWAAMRAREALDIEWGAPPGVDVAHANSVDYLRALEAALPSGRTARRESDVDAAFATAARTMTATYAMPFQAHAVMEPLNCIADVRRDGCELWVGTQAPNQAQERVARLLGIPLDAVTVNVMLMGGGFGRRLDIDYVLEAVEVSRAVQRKVQLVWTREDDLRHDRYQPAQAQRASVALSPSGTILGWRHQVADYNLTMFGPYDPAFDPSVDGDPSGAFDNPYAFPAIDVTLALLPSPVPSGAWRSVSYPASVFARECFLDEVARATGRDPVALRLDLIPSPGITRRGVPNGDRLRAVLDLAAERAGWGKVRRPVADGRRWGRGIACNSYSGQTMVAQVAEVSVGPAGDVRVHRLVCAMDCGRVINRWGVEGQVESGVVWALSAALKGHVTFVQGRTRESNFHDFPVLRMHEAPKIEVHLVDSSLRPFGVGEPPVPPVTAAVFNAVFDATAVRVRRLPLDPRELRASGGPSRRPAGST